MNKLLNSTILLLLLTSIFLASFTLQNKTIHANTNKEDGLLLKETFEDFGITIDEIQLAYSKLLSKDMDQQNVNNFKERIEGVFTTNLSRVSEKKDYIKFQGQIKSDNLSNGRIIFVAIPNKKDNGTFETYLLIKLPLKSTTGYGESYSYLNKSLKALSIEPEINVNLRGNINKKLDHKEQEQIIRNMFKKLNGTIIEGLNEETIISLTGYSSKFKSAYKSNNNLINLQIASRYNADHKKTEFTIGSPLITMEH
jgi:hypothetical protein